MPTNFPTTVPTMSRLINPRKRAHEEPPTNRCPPPYESSDQDDDDVALFGMVSSAVLVRQGVAQFQSAAAGLTAPREIAAISEPLRQKRVNRTWLHVQATTVMR